MKPLPLLLSLLWLLPLAAREPVSPPDPPPAPPATSLQEPNETRRNTLVSLSGLLESLQAREREQDELHARLQAAGDEVRRAAIRRDLEETIEAVAALRAEFNRISLATDVSMFDRAPEDAPFDWQREAVQLFQPLLGELKKMTAESRELAELNSRLEDQTRRRNAARSAMANIDQLLKGEMDPDLRSRLTDNRQIWATRMREADSQIVSIQSTLDERLALRETPMERTRGAATHFVRTRGRNLFLGLLAFLAVFLGMRFLYAFIRKIKPAGTKGRSFSTRLFTLVWTLMGVVFGVGAMLAMFNAVGDLFLLSLTILFLLGVIWGSIKTLPAFVEQFRMMLNMGAVKEDERLLFEGIPWKVDSIGFRTRLVNPLLDGGEITLPTRMLVGMYSRLLGKREELFPSREKDWVLLADKTYGRVVYQNPAFVQIVQPGGSQKLIQTADYLGMAPVVLSTGYRREVIFGLDYGHQNEITTRIPARMKEHLQGILEEKLGKGLQHLRVDLQNAADSSLDLAVLIDCGPDVGQHWNMIPRWVQSALVDLCNQENWTIPFPQLKVHSTQDRG